MNVAIVLPHFHDEGGIERRTSELVKGLLAEGHDVHVFSTRWNEELVRATIGPEHMHQVPMWKPGAALKTFSFALFAKRATSEKNFDIVHSQARTLGEDVVTAGGGSHRAWWEISLRDTSSMMDRARLRLSTFHRTVLWMEKIQYRRCRALIANSEFSRRAFVEINHVPAEKTHVVHNGVDACQFTPLLREQWRDSLRASLGYSDGDLVVLHVGSGFFRKGLGELIEAVSIARARGMSMLRLLVVGGGDTLPWQGLARKFGVLDSVRFEGSTTHAERYYAAADTFVLLTRFDPFANSTMEALASGLPVITTSSNGVAEILRNGVDGFVVDCVKDVNNVAIRLKELADPARREEVGKAGRDLVQNSYTWQHTTRKTIDVYRHVIAGREAQK